LPRVINYIKRITYFFFIFLLLISIYGLYTPPNSYPASGNISGYNYSNLNSDSIVYYLNNKSKMKLDRNWLMHTNNLVASTLVHGSHSTLKFENNWLLWFLSRIKGKELLFTQNPFLIAESKTAICSQAVSVLNSILNLNGIPTHFISFNGHVLSYAKVDSVWYLLDPDFGLFFEFNLNEFSDYKNRKIIQEQLKIKGFDSLFSSLYFASTKKMLKVHKVGEAHEPKRWLIENITTYLCFLIPCTYILLFYRGNFIYKV
jgi:hypothetical protein